MDATRFLDLWCHVFAEDMLAIGEVRFFLVGDVFCLHLVGCIGSCGKSAYIHQQKEALDVCEKRAFCLFVFSDPPCNDSDNDRCCEETKGHVPEKISVRWWVSSRIINLNGLDDKADNDAQTC